MQTLLILGDTTEQVWDGLQVVQQDTGEVDETNLVRDVTGDVAIQNTGGLLADDTRWGLTDRLGSTVAQTQGSKITQTTKYSDWGVPTFASLGWNSQTGYTGELTDATTGLNAYYARAYHPMSGTWLSADPYRGTMTDPATLGRYAYVGGNPTTLTDAYGYRLQEAGTSKYMGGSLQTCLQEYGFCRTHNGKTVAGPKPASPSGASDTTKRHPSPAASLQALGLALSIAGNVLGGMALENLRRLVNGVASIGNFLLSNPELVTDILAGLGLILIGGAGEIGGGALDITGAGAVVGVPINIASAGAIGLGVTGVGTGMAGLINEAASGDYSVEPWQHEANPLANNGSGSSVRRPIDEELDAAQTSNGRFPQKNDPNSTLVRRDSEGNVTNYQTYGPDGLPVQRVGVTGASHGGIEIPHVQEFIRGTNPTTGEVFVNKGVVRPARPEEIPLG